MIHLNNLLLQITVYINDTFAASCTKMLDSTTCTDHDGQVYCKSCYGRNFGPKGYGFAGGASGLSMDTGRAGEVTTEYVFCEAKKL